MSGVLVPTCPVTALIRLLCYRMEMLNLRAGPFYYSCGYDGFIDDLSSNARSVHFLPVCFRHRLDLVVVAEKDARLCVETLHSILFLEESIFELDENS